MQKLILGSTSITRKEQLSRLGIPFEVIAPEVEESQLPDESAYEMVARLALAKAQAVAQRLSEGLIIGCDQAICLGKEVFGKPGNHAAAVDQLTKMSGQQIISWTALCLFNARTQQRQLTVERYDVYFRHLTQDMIEHYLQRDQPYHCAGSIKAEKLGVVLFDRLIGDDFSALLGLPLIKLTRFLEKEGMQVI